MQFDARKIWNIVSNGDQPAPYDFAIKSKARQRGAAIHARLERLLKAENDRATDFSALNRKLRVECVEIFRSGNLDKQRELADWIVRDWGGIRSLGKARVPKWLNTLGNFSDNEIAHFVMQQKNQCISSWSKILAFRDPENHAIYDARTATALNTALYDTRDHRTFHMPKGRNQFVEPARAKLETLTSPSLSYRDYIGLLREFVSLRCVPSILDAEMAIFANAPSVCHMFVQKPDPAGYPPPLSRSALIASRAS